ncbi:MAG: hypothetical protein IBX72_01665 [Nitrospirae bacterium]|nr:hypothetical protein [Nitrospirota bacterium]
MSLIPDVELVLFFIKDNKLYTHRTCIKNGELHGCAVLDSNIDLIFLHSNIKRVSPDYS